MMSDPGQEHEAPTGPMSEAAFVEAYRQGLVRKPISASDERSLSDKVDAVVEAALAAREEPRFDQVVLDREEFERIRRAEGFTLYVRALGTPIGAEQRRNYQITVEWLIEKAGDVLAAREDTERPDGLSAFDALRAVDPEHEVRSPMAPADLQRAAAQLPEGPCRVCGNLTLEKFEGIWFCPLHKAYFEEYLARLVRDTEQEPKQ
jgi:hypothetical protein